MRSKSLRGDNNGNEKCQRVRGKYSEIFSGINSKFPEDIKCTSVYRKAGCTGKATLLWTPAGNFPGLLS